MSLIILGLNLFVCIRIAKKLWLKRKPVLVLYSLDVFRAAIDHLGWSMVTWSAIEQRYLVQVTIAKPTVTHSVTDTDSHRCLLQKQASIGRLKCAVRHSPVIGT